MTLDGTSGITQMTGSIVMSGSTSGTTTIIPSAVAGTTTVTMPAATGTMMVSGNMPAFSAYQSASQTISGGVNTKITFTTKEFDTNTNYDTSTSKFTPTVAGYYQVDASVCYSNATAGEQLRTQIYKNGSQAKIGTVGNSTSTQAASSNVSALIYMSGSTDYLEIYIYSSGLGGTTPTNAFAGGTYFQAAMVRSA